MRTIWNITIDQYLEVIELAKSHGKVAGMSMEEELLQIMEKYGNKPSGHSELSQDELLQEVASHGKSVLGMETKDGKTIYKTIMKNENNTNLDG
jgi:hypothetical protein